MTKQVHFEISIEGVTLEVLASRLERSGIKVLSYSKTELGKDAYDSSHIISIGYFPDSVALELAVSQMNSLRVLDGVKEVKIFSVSQSKEKTKKWYDHFMIPLLISTAVNTLGIFGILLGGNTILDWKIYLGIFLFGVTSFFGAAGVAPEAYIANELRGWSSNLEGRTQLAVQKFTDVLDSLPVSITLFTPLWVWIYTRSLIL